MKKKILSILLATTMAVVMMSCGANEVEKNANEEIAVEDTIEESTSMAEEKAAKPEITMESFDGSSDPEDTSVRYDYSYQKPVVTIPGNEAAQAKIQSEIDAVIEHFLAQLTSNEFGVTYEDVEVASFMGLTYGVVRADDKVISILFSNEGYDHGAHGWNNVFYRNFYVATGERITFDSIGTEFRAKSLELVDDKRIEYANKIYEEEGYSPFFEDCQNSYPYVVCDGTELSSEVLKQVFGDDAVSEGVDSYLEPMFGITDTGFIFTSGQYVLQPYAAGIIDFEIPAEEYGEVITEDLF